MQIIRNLGLYIGVPWLVLNLVACTQTFSVEVDSVQKISESSGNLNLTFNPGDQFAAAVGSLGDLDLDGVTDLVVGKPYDDDNGADSGAVRIVFLQNDGQVKDSLKITAGINGFVASFNDNEHFGAAAASPGDLDGDGIQDLVVGAPGDNDNGTARGALWILFLNTDGSVRSQQKISDISGGFVTGLNDNDQFGGAVAGIGDLNGDGVPDLAIGSAWNSDGGNQRGAVYILLLNRDGTVQAQQKISSTAGGFSGNLHDVDHFGSAVAGIGDLDGDGIADLAVGADGDDSGGSERGAVWILFLNRDGTVKGEQKISQNDGQFDQFLSDGDHFGSSLANVGDMNGDGRNELAVGANQSDDGGPGRGAVFVLFLKPGGEVISSSRISQNAGNFPATLVDGDQFGDAIAGLGDLDGDGNLDIAVGANLDDDGGTDKGALWMLFMSPVKVGYRTDPNVDLATYFSGNS